MKLAERLGRILSFALTGLLVSGISFAAVTNWSTTSALNVESTGVSGTGGGVSIDEGMPPSNVNNGMRDMMAQIATWRTAATIGNFFSQTVIGHTAALSIGGNSDNFEVFGTTAATGGVAAGMFNATAGTAAHLDFYRSKNASIGSATVVASGDTLGLITAYGAQQTGTFATQNPAGQIAFLSAGTVTSGAGADMPGSVVVRTTPDGSGTLADRLTIGPDGTVTVASSGALVLPQASSPAPTVEGDERWDTDDDVYRVGNGSTSTQVGIDLGTLTATTSGTTFSISSIPAGTKRITIMWNGFSANSTTNMVMTIGDSGGLETAGYLGAGGATPTNGTAAFIVSTGNAAASVMHGVATLTLMDAATNLWAYQASLSRSNATTIWTCSGTKALSATLDRLEFNAGGDTFDAGSMSWMIE